MILTHPGLTKLTFMDYLLTMLRILLRRKQGYDKTVMWMPPTMVASTHGGVGSRNRILVFMLAPTLVTPTLVRETCTATAAERCRTLPFAAER